MVEIRKSKWSNTARNKISVEHYDFSLALADSCVVLSVTMEDCSPLAWIELYTFSLQDKLHYPTGSEVSVIAKNFISGLLCDARTRMDYDEIVKHKFFDDMDMSAVRNCMLTVELSVIWPRMCIEFASFA